RLPRPRRRVSRAALFFALLSLVLGVLLYRDRTRPRETAPAPARTPTRPRPPVSARRERPSAPSAQARRDGASPLRTLPPSSSPGGVARIAILIDDLGNDRAAVDRIAAWTWPVSTAVLPALPDSAETARELERSGKEILLHLPMEPKGFPQVRPGPGVVLRSQSDEEIARTLADDLDSVP